MFLLGLSIDFDSAKSALSSRMALSVLFRQGEWTMCSYFYSERCERRAMYKRVWSGKTTAGKKIATVLLGNRISPRSLDEQRRTS